MCSNFNQGVKKKNLALTPMKFFRFNVLGSYLITDCEILKSLLYLVLIVRLDVQNMTKMQFLI